MNKKLIALAVAAAFAAPAAMAEVVLYGKVHMDIVASDDGTDDTISVTSNASRLGVKGSEDLDNGLKAIFKYEMTYSGVDGGTTISATDGTSTAIGAARNSYIGLAGDFGTFIVGRHDTPAKSAFYAAGNDHLGDSIIDLNRMHDTINNVNYGFTERRVNNAVAYMSPAMSGFKAAVAIVPGEQTGADDQNDENGLMDSYSLGVMYKGNGVKAGLGYEKIADSRTTTADNQDTTTLHLGASYTFDSFTVGAQYAKNDDVNNVDGTETTTWALAGKYKFGNNAIIANYGNNKTETAANVTSADTNYTGVAFQHSMSKRTSVYVAFNNEDSDNTADNDEFAVGMVHTF